MHSHLNASKSYFRLKKKFHEILPLLWTLKYWTLNIHGVVSLCPYACCCQSFGRMVHGERWKEETKNKRQKMLFIVLPMDHERELWTVWRADIPLLSLMQCNRRGPEWVFLCEHQGLLCPPVPLDSSHSASCPPRPSTSITCCCHSKLFAPISLSRVFFSLHPHGLSLQLRTNRLLRCAFLPLYPPPPLFSITSCCPEASEPNLAWQRAQKEKQASRLSNNNAK